MIRAIIICAGSVVDYGYIGTFVREGDMVICADGGFEHARKMGCRPDVIVGDMDSLGELPQDTKIVRFPTKKDLTDTEIAVQYAITNGATEVILLGAIGSRMDHSMTNILMMINVPCSVTIVDENQKITLVNSHIDINERIGTVVSLVPLTRVSGIVTRGLEYPLDNESLEVGFGRGVSNIVTSKDAAVSLKSGKLLLVVNRY